MAAALLIGGALLVRDRLLGKPAHGSAVLVQGRGVIIGTSGHYKFCAGSLLFTLPATCGGGIPLAITDAAVTSAPGYTVITGTDHVGTDLLGLVGWWDGDVLTVAKRVAADDVAQKAYQAPLPEPACTAPGSGPAASSSQAGSDAIDWAIAQDTYAGSWLSNSRRVVHIAFTGDPEKQRPEIRRRYLGPLCLIAAKHTQAFIAQTQARLLQGAPGADGRWIQVTGSNAGFDRVEINVMYASPADVAALRTQSIPELVVHSELTPLAADSPLARDVH